MLPPVGTNFPSMIGEPSMCGTCIADSTSWSLPSFILRCCRAGRSWTEQPPVLCQILCQSCGPQCWPEFQDCSVNIRAVSLLFHGFLSVRRRVHIHPRRSLWTLQPALSSPDGWSTEIGTQSGRLHSKNLTPWPIPVNSFFSGLFATAQSGHGKIFCSCPFAWEGLRDLHGDHLGEVTFDQAALRVAAQLFSLLLVSHLFHILVQSLISFILGLHRQFGLHSQVATGEAVWEQDHSILPRMPSPIRFRVSQSLLVRNERRERKVDNRLQESLEVGRPLQSF